MSDMHGAIVEEIFSPGCAWDLSSLIGIVSTRPPGRDGLNESRMQFGC
jgi:hypothetical protein